jgi:hypothetical protein
VTRRAGDAGEDGPDGDGAALRSAVDVLALVPQVDLTAA